MAQSLIAKVRKNVGKYYVYDACVSWETTVDEFRDRMGVTLDFFARFCIIEFKAHKTVIVTPADTDCVRGALSKLDSLQRRATKKNSANDVASQVGRKRRQPLHEHVNYPLQVLFHFDRVDTFCRFLGCNADDRAAKKSTARVPDQYSRDEQKRAETQIVAAMKKFVKSERDALVQHSVELDRCNAIGIEAALRRCLRTEFTLSLRTPHGENAQKFAQRVLVTVYKPALNVDNAERDANIDYGEQLFEKLFGDRRRSASVETNSNSNDNNDNNDHGAAAAFTKIKAPKVKRQRRRNSERFTELPQVPDDSASFVDIVGASERSRLKRTRVLRLYEIGNNAAAQFAGKAVPVFCPRDGLYVYFEENEKSGHFCARNDELCETPTDYLVQLFAN